MENDIIVKSNDIVEASYRLTLQEQKIILYMASQIKKEDENFKPINLNISDFKNLLEIKNNSQYKEIQNITKKLRKRDLIIKQNKTTLQTGWISSAKYFHGKGYVELRFDPNLKPYLLQLKDRFTKYYLKHVIQMDHSYSIRFYELLKQYESIGYRYFELNELMNTLGIEQDEYKLYADFKKRIIKPVKVEFDKKYHNEELDITFEFEEYKKVRKVIGLRFDILKPPYQKLPKPQPNTPKEKSPDSELLNDLLEMKVSKRQANSLIKKYAPDIIQRNIELTKNRAANEMIDNVPAFLIQAIKNDYAKDLNPINPESRELRAKAIACWNKNNGSCQSRWTNHKDNTSSACHYCPRFKTTSEWQHADPHASVSNI